MSAGALGSSSLWRVAALTLLLCAAFDVLAIDTALWRPAGASDSECGCSSDEDCFCCCRHIVVVQPVVFEPLTAVIRAADDRTPHLEPVSPPTPFHPPRA